MFLEFKGKNVVQESKSQEAISAPNRVWTLFLALLYQKAKSKRPSRCPLYLWTTLCSRGSSLAKNTSGLFLLACQRIFLALFHPLFFIVKVWAFLKSLWIVSRRFLSCWRDWQAGWPLSALNLFLLSFNVFSKELVNCPALILEPIFGLMWSIFSNWSLTWNERK